MSKHDDKFSLHDALMLPSAPSERARLLVRRGRRLLVSRRRRAASQLTGPAVGDSRCSTTRARARRCAGLQSSLSEAPTAHVVVSTHTDRTPH